MPQDTRVNITVNASSPEPPRGSFRTDVDGLAWQRLGNQWVSFAGGHQVTTWAELAPRIDPDARTVVTATAPAKVGDTVHYVSHGTPPDPSGRQAYTVQCRAAIVTEIPDGVDNPQTIGLCVLNPTGQFFDRSVPLDDGGDRYASISTRGQGASEPVLQRRTGPILCDGRQHDGGTWHRPPRKT